MVILLGNKQNSLILLGLFSFSRMEIPVYNLGEYKTGVQNQRKSALTILLSSKTLKTLSFAQIIIRESY